MPLNWDEKLMSDYKEELFEEGFIESITDGIATVIIESSATCEECSAKVYCKPKDSDGRKLSVKEYAGAEVGDKVRVSIKGKNLLLASIYLYGIPLFILVGTLLTGMNTFQNNPELYSFLSAIAILTIYFLFLWTFSEKLNKNSKIIPEIVAVYKSNHI